MPLIFFDTTYDQTDDVQKRRSIRDKRILDGIGVGIAFVLVVPGDRDRAVEHESRPRRSLLYSSGASLRRPGHVE